MISGSVMPYFPLRILEHTFSRASNIEFKRRYAWHPSLVLINPYRRCLSHEAGRAAVLRANF
jgi:hypothetical protein